MHLLPRMNVMLDFIWTLDTTNIFQFLAIFSIEFLLFYPKIANFGSIQLGIIANIVS